MPLMEVILGTKLTVLFPAIPLAIITQCYNFGRLWIFTLSVIGLTPLAEIVNFLTENNENSQILLLGLLCHMSPLMFRYHSDGNELEVILVFVRNVI
ncbi:hypothetical protein GIB67_028385, partial [Kingdonia uniflora]